MTPPEYYALKHKQLLEDIVYPKADRLGPMQDEIDMLDRQRLRRRSRATRWAGAGLVRVGTRLMTMGERLVAQPANGTPGVPHPDAAAK